MLWRLKNSKVSTKAWSGVTSNALAAAQMASLRENVDGSGVRGQLLVDLPVVERHPGLTGQHQEDGLDVVGFGQDSRTPVNGVEYQVTPSGGVVATPPSG
jgi:hypothetical protein